VRVRREDGKTAEKEGGLDLSERSVTVDASARRRDDEPKALYEAKSNGGPRFRPDPLSGG